MSINYRLRTYIKAKGLLINHVADKSNIPRKKMYRMLNGTTKITVDEYEMICKNGLEVDPEFFLKLNS